MSDLSRRDALKLLGVLATVPTLSLAGCTGEDAAEVRERAAAQDAGDDYLTGTTRPGADYERRFFTDHEYETVHVLADLVIPADERSGSATDAGVPAFIDFVMTDELLGGPQRMRERQTALRGGLAWLDHQSHTRFDAAFLDATNAQRRTLLDAIAYPDEAEPAMRPGVVFFNTFRDLVASGFFSSKMGVADVQYIGNRAVARWRGCPEEVLDHIGVSQQA